MNIIPLHDHHAIESVSFGLEWMRPLAAEVMQALGGMHDGSLRQRLPARKPLRRIAWSLSPEGAHTLSTHDQTGWVFERFMPDGQPEISLLLAPEMIAVTNRAYTRWSAIAEEARALLAPFLPIIGAGSDGFTTVGLQYVDVFMIDGPLAAFRPAMVFNSATTLLPPSVFTRRNLWHAHHGYFTEITAPVCARQLTVVNTDLVMEGERLLLRINSSHRMIHDQALTVANLLDGDAGGQLAWAMNTLHDENQQILRDLIEPGLQTRIGLANNPGVAQ